MQTNSAVEKNIFQINAEKGNLFFLGHQKEQKQIEAPKFFSNFETPQVKRSNSFLENMDTEYNKSSVKRELSPSLLSEGLEMEDLHYYIDQRFDTTPKIDSYVCGKKRRLKHLNNEDQQLENCQINNLKDSEEKNQGVRFYKLSNLSADLLNNKQAAFMSIQENRKEVQVSREYNLLTSGKNEKPNYLNGKHASKLNQDQPAQQQENSCIENNIQQCGSMSNTIGSQNSANAPYQRNGNTQKQQQNGKSATEEKKINDEKQQKKNDYSEIQQILKSCTTEAKGLQDQDDDDDEDDVEFEIVSYEDSSEDEEERSKMITEDENEKNASGNHSQEEKKPEETKIVKADISEKPQQNQQQQQQKQIQQLGLCINTSLEKEDEHIKNESSEEDIFSEYAKIGSGYAQYNLPKLLQDINTMENHKKVAEIQNTQALQTQQNATQQQKDTSSTVAVNNPTFDKTRNKQAQNKSSTGQQQQNLESQHKTAQQRIQYCHQQLQQKRVINTRSSGAGSKGNGGSSVGKSSYNNQNNTIGNDYQPKYFSSRKRRAVTDPELESLGLLNKRRNNKNNNNRHYNEESETTNQDQEDDNDESEEENQTNKKRQQQAPKPKSVDKSNTRNNDKSHQKPQNTTAQNKKKAEQSQNAAEDDYPDVPITLSKDQQMELLKYHKRSKNYHGTAKQFGISHEEARVIVKKLKKEYRSITNF